MRRILMALVGVSCLTSIGITRLSARPQDYGPPSEPAATPVGQAASVRDISGFWELSFDSRKVPKASLLPTLTAAKLQARAKHDEYAIRWCNLLGMPFIMDSGRPLDIRQGPTAIIITPENSSAPRYLYLNRSAHVPDEIFDPSTNGDSIARWEGDTLVVDTNGFHGDSWRRISDREVASGRAVSACGERTGLVGHVHLDRCDRLSRAAHI
jgi:hypothetical protein